MIFADFDINELKFDDKGLIPAIVQDYFSKQVLTLAYMNKESLDITLKEGKTCFWSRSRQELWRKGETSGNYQKVVTIKADCDKDALVIEVIKDGPACHTGAESCFFNDFYQADDVTPFSYEALYDMIKGNCSPELRVFTQYDKGYFDISKKCDMNYLSESDVETLQKAFDENAKLSSMELALKSCTLAWESAWKEGENTSIRMSDILDEIDADEEIREIVKNERETMAALSVENV